MRNSPRKKRKNPAFVKPPAGTKAENQRSGRHSGMSRRARKAPQEYSGEAMTPEWLANCLTWLIVIAVMVLAHWLVP